MTKRAVHHVRAVGRVLMFLAIPVPAFLSGCAPLEIQGPRPCVRERCRETLTVAVAAFQDDRAVEEIGTPPPVPFPVAEDVVQEMSTDLARHLVEAFANAEFFLDTSLVERSGSPPPAALLASLASRGYDAVVTGNVPRCLGSTCVVGGDVVGYFALRLVGLVVPVLMPLPFGFYHNEGVVAIEDLRLTDTRTGEVVWQGDFSRKVVHYSGDPSPGPAIHKAMLEVSQDVLDELQAQLRSGRQKRPVPEGFDETGDDRDAIPW